MIFTILDNIEQVSMKKVTLSFILAIVFFGTTTLQSQNEVDENLTLKAQFEELINSSNSYEQYKVIKKTNLEEFKSIMSDSISMFYRSIQNYKQTIAEQQSEINTLEEDLQNSIEERDEANLEKGSIYFMGAQMEKSSYKTLMWVIIAVLALALVFFIYKFIDSNRVTVYSKRELAEIQREMDEQRKTHIKKEQKIMRQLQDEINKNL